MRIELNTEKPILGHLTNPPTLEQHWWSARRTRRRTTPTSVNVETTGHYIKRRLWTNTPCQTLKASPIKWGGQQYFPNWTCGADIIECHREWRTASRERFGRKSHAMRVACDAFRVEKFSSLFLEEDGPHTSRSRLLQMLHRRHSHLVTQPGGALKTSGGSLQATKDGGIDGASWQVCLLQQQHQLVRPTHLGKYPYP